MRTLIVAYSFENLSGIDRYSKLLDAGLIANHYEHDRFAYGQIKINPILRIFKLPNEVRKYEPDIIHLTQPHGYEAFLHTKAIKVLTWHDNMIFTRKGMRQVYNIYRGETAIKLADVITFNSKKSMFELEKYCRERHIQLEDKLLSVNPIPIDDIWIKQKINKDIERRDFTYVGAIHYPHKNLSGLLFAFANILEEIPSMQKPFLNIFTASPNPRKIIAEKLKEIAKEEVMQYIRIYEKATDEEILKVLKRSIAL
ncbi:MAG: hypothetical protein ACP5RP_04590, partial [Candidatus Micrarchaeia archaeon]